MKVGGWNYYIIISRSFLAWTPLGTARHTGSEHSGREAWTDVNTGLELIPGTLPGGLVLKPPPRSTNRLVVVVVVAAEAPGLLELVHHGLDLLNLLDPPVGVALLGLEGPSVVVVVVVVVPVASTAPVVVVPVASTAPVVVLVSPVSSSPRPAVITAPAGRWSPVTPSVWSSAPRSSSLESSVPWSSVRSRAGITPVLGLTGVSLTGGVGLPGPVLGTGGPAPHTERGRRGGTHLMGGPTGQKNSQRAPGRSREQ